MFTSSGLDAAAATPDGTRLDELLDPLGSGDAPVDFWLRHLRAGLLLFAGATFLAAAYLLGTPDGPHRGLEWLMVAASLVATGVVVALPRKAIVRSTRRMVFFVTWSAFSCSFVSVAAALDDGLRSPLALFVFMPIVYASLAYPVPAVVGIGAIGAASAAGAAIAAGDTLARSVVFVGTIGMVTLLCASVTRARREQQAARQHLTARLVELATRDGLTGCLNHRSFYGAVEDELARAARHGHDVSLLVIDVDAFKSINDTLGHVAGDEVLRGIGAVLTAAGRSTDVVGRIGGDEFAVLLVETDRARADAAADRLVEAVSHMAGPVPVSVTVGVAHIAHPTLEDTPQRIVALADARLYERKHLLSDERHSGQTAR